MLKNSRILITGGTGSLGKSLIQFLLTNTEYCPKKIKVLSRDEDKQHSLYQFYKNTVHRDIIEYVIGDVRSFSTIVSCLQDIDIVIHAAAMKHVPVCENFPYETVQTNILGAYNIVSAIECGFPVKRVIGISTDKACDPINVYGMTKFIQEKIFALANTSISTTDFISVRYGNVLGSRGSVIPLFQEQIKSGGPITVTHEDMTRFFFSLEDAVDTIITALNYGKRGQILVPNIKSFSIMNLAKIMSFNSTIPIVITGMRPGEKLHEILISEYEIHKTELETFNNKQYYIINHDCNRKLVNPKMPHTSEKNINTLEETYQLLYKNKFL